MLVLSSLRQLARIDKQDLKETVLGNTVVTALWWMVWSVLVSDGYSPDRHLPLQGELKSV